MDNSRVKFEEFGNGVVKASISDCRFDAIDYINDKIVQPVTSAIQVKENFKNNSFEKYLMKHTYSAIARCSNDDSYSFEEGKKIALKRLSEKYTKSLDRRVALFFQHMNQVCKNLDVYFEHRTF